MEGQECPAESGRTRRSQPEEDADHGSNSTAGAGAEGLGPQDTDTVCEETDEGGLRRGLALYTCRMLSARSWRARLQQCSIPTPRPHKLRGILKFQLRSHFQDFSGGLVVKTSPSNAGDVGLILGWGAKIPCALWSEKPKHKTEAIL